MNESYYDLKTLHAFLNDFGPHLATTVTTFPDKRPLKPGDNETLRMSVRSHGNSGYVFINNYQRLLEMIFVSVFSSKAVQNCFSRH